MAVNKKLFKNKEELIDHIKTHVPSFYYSSQTSTVIPYDHLEEVFKENEFCLCDLSLLPKKISLQEDETLLIEGPISWKDAKEYLQQRSYTIKTSPTEELALISAGAATSATGERYFHFGGLRSQIKEITYINFKGEEKTLHRENKFPQKSLKPYQSSCQEYKEFKNPPFPIFENETDLLIGTEGQLGVITSLKLEVTKNENVNYIFILIPKWEEDDSAHLEILQKVQNFRNHTHICEFIDSNAFSFLKEDERPNNNKDAIFFEVKSELLEDFYENFISKLNSINIEDVFEVPRAKFHQIRAGVPRAVFEENSRMSVKKMGTDIQVKIKDFAKLMEHYRKLTLLDIPYNLFGHFGDAHLHFNFMPNESQAKTCQKELEKLYTEVKKLQGSPFAEHGIGIIKQKFIKDFWGPEQYNFFQSLKSIHDPYNQFFPQGFMCLK